MASEIGVTGLRRWGGTVDEEFLPQLKGERGVRVFAEMRDNDPVVGSMLFAVETLMRGVHWAVEPVSDDPPAVEAAEFTESVMHDMSVTWEDTIVEILSMVPFGWSYHEIVYKQRTGPQDGGLGSRHNDGRVGWRKLPIRAQETLFEWEFDEDGGVLGMHQWDPASGGRYFIPIEKALLFRTTIHKNNPQGRSMLRNAYRPWYFKKHLESIEGIGIERNLAGLPVAYAPAEWFGSEASADDQARLADLQKVMANIRKDEQAALIIPSLFDELNGQRILDVKLMQSGGGERAMDTGAVIARKNQEIALSILADVILLGHEKVGTQALAREKADMFTAALNALNKNIAAVIGQHGFRRLFRLNGIPEDLTPTLAPQALKRVDLEALAKYVTALSGAGAMLFPDEQLENHLRREADLPEAVEDGPL